MKSHVSRAITITLLAAFVVSASACAIRPRKCGGRRGINTPMGVM